MLAEDLEQTLKTFMQEDNSAEQAVNNAGGSPGAAAARRTRKTVINSHKESNSLLISAAGTRWKQVRALVESLDTRQPQVLIEAAVVELTTSDLDRFGIELGLLDLPSDTSGTNDYSRGFGFTSFGQSTVPGHRRRQPAGHASARLREPAAGCHGAASSAVTALPFRC